MTHNQRSPAQPLRLSSMAALAACLLRELGHAGMRALAAAIYMSTLGAAMTYVQVQLALASRSKGATASFVPI